MIAKSFGEIPAAAELTADDEVLLAKVSAGFDSVGDLIGRHRLRQAIAEAMRVVGEVNKYVTDQAPFKLKGEDERERLGTILHVTAQAVVDLNTILSRSCRTRPTRCTPPSAETASSCRCRGSRRWPTSTTGVPTR